MRLWFHSVPTPMTLKRIFFLAGLLGQLTAVGLAGRFAVGQDDQLRQLAGAGELLDFAHAEADALVHRRAARIDFEHVDLLDDILDLVFVGELVGGSTTWALWAKATMEMVSSGLSLLMAAMAAS